MTDEAPDPVEPITLSHLGSFFFAGSVSVGEDGETFHGDHGYAQYFVPQPARNLPIIMWHGLGQSGKTWESTPDGREGFWQLFLRRGWPVYIIDQPRRGRAGRSMVSGPDVSSAVIPSTGRESAAWRSWRLGPWYPPAEPVFYRDVQFAQDPDSVAQFFRQQTPNTGPEPFPDANHRGVLGGAVAQLCQTVGPCVLMTHSHSSQYGWITAVRAEGLVQAIVAFEPGEFAFPEDDLPCDVPTDSDMLASFMAPQPVPTSEFDALARIPILIILGDNIASAPSTDFGAELRRMVRERAHQFVAAVNKRGGDATCLELPSIGLRGNTHFAMSDLNNVAVADVVSNFLAERELDAFG